MSEWIKCSERLPSKNGFYLIYPWDDGHVESFFNQNQFAITRLYGVEVTHWMPLPPALEEE